PKFDLQLKIIDLNNVPLVTGTSYVKWHFPSSTSAEHRGHTPKFPIREHKVTWDYTRTLPVRLTVDKNGSLQDSEIHFEVLQEYSPSARAERIVLGYVKLNLAEFVEGSEENEEGIVRRYLMQESKINSTLKIGIHMKQTEGERTFIAPPLKTAPVFGGIAGIMTTEQGDADDGGNMPSMSSKAQESGKLQDLYRRNLAASWTAQAGELPADQCIEDIFAGGDGWGGNHSAGPPQNPRTAGASTEDDSDGDKRTVRGHRRKVSGSTVKQDRNNHHKTNSGPSAVGGRTSIEQQVHASSDARRHRDIKPNEINEFLERDDLKSWVISAPG
ncbi:MAG: hypothetical protein Q9163_006070, partial [Psora crenata]